MMNEQCGLVCLIIQLCTMKKHIVTFNNEVLETDQILVSVRSFYFTSGTIFCTYLHDVKYFYTSAPPQPVSPCPTQSINKYYSA